MPSSSKKQHNFMAAVAHSPSFARKVGVPQSVGKDFTEADKGRKMSGSKYVLGTLKGTGAGAGETKGDSTRGNKKLEQMMGKMKSARDGYSSKGAGSIKGYNGQKGSLVKPGQVPKGKDPAEWWSANEAGAVKPGEKSYLPPKKKVPPKTKKYVEGGPIVPGTLKGTGAGAGQTKGDTDKSSAKSSSEPKERGFFGSLFTGHLKDYNAQEKRKRDIKSTFSGVKAAPKEEKKAAPDIDLSGGVETKEDVEKRHKEASDKAAASQPKKQSFKEAFAAAKGKPFPWNGKMYSGAKKASAPKAKTATTKKVDTTVDKRENNRLRQSNPVYWDAAKKVANNKPASSTAPKKPTNPRGSMAGKTASAPAKNARGSMSGFTPSKNKAYNYAAGGSIQAFKKGGLVGSRADGIASRGRTKCKIR